MQPNDRSHRRTDDGRTDAPTPDPTDPDAEVWDVPTDHRWGKLVTDAIGGTGVVVHEAGTEVDLTDGEGAWFVASQADQLGLEANR